MNPPWLSNFSVDPEAPLPGESVVLCEPEGMETRVRQVLSDGDGIYEVRDDRGYTIYITKDNETWVQVMEV